MIKVTSEQDKVCVAKVHEAGQGHVLDGWESLSTESQRELIAQLNRIDFQQLKRLVALHIHSSEDFHEERVLKPLTDVQRARDVERQERELRRTLGEYALRHGELALVMVAGNDVSSYQSEPFGMLPVGPVTGKSLFQLQAEKIRALNRHYKVSLRWFIFCHPDQLELISAFFKEHGYFGLNCSDIHFCAQELLPVVNRRGKLFLSRPGEIAMSTVGDGGILLQLLQEEHLKAFERANIQNVFYFPADNPLVEVVDPTFLGLHIKNQSDVSSKAVPRTDPDDPLPVFCRFNNSVGVAWPSDLSEAERKDRSSTGQLTFSTGAIGIHLFSLEFLRRLKHESVQLSVRGVPQCTEGVDKRNRVVRPTEPNSIRFQSFIFEAISSARRTSVFEVSRADEFSPIRNTSGTHSPQTAQRDLSQLYTRWLERACAELDGADQKIESAVEISPLYAMDVQELKDKIELPLSPENGAILLGGKT